MKGRKNIGDSGEEIAINYLGQSGWKLARYGKEIERTAGKELSVVCDSCLDLPFGGQKYLKNEIDEPEIINSFLTNSRNIEGDFVRANAVVDKYIKLCYQKWLDENPMPFPEEPGVMSSNLSEKSKEANCEHIKKFPGSDHPGRYDYIGLNNNDYFALEVKANSVKFGYWQELRLKMLEAFKINVMLVKVKNKNPDAPFDKVEVCSLPESRINVPDFQEVGDLLSYKPINERIRSLLLSRKISSSELMKLVESGASKADILRQYENS